MANRNYKSYLKLINNRKSFFLKIKAFTLLIIALSIFLQIISVNTVYSAPIDLLIGNGTDKDDVLKIKAPAAILVDIEKGQVLYRKSVDKKLHISTANKIMTAILIIEKGNLESKATISKESTELEGSVLFLSVGEKYALDDLLNAIIISNANDAANALAEYAGGDVRKFVELMNNKAKELHMNNTFFTNPTGLFDDNQYTTAKDIATLMRYALSIPDFNRIFSYRAVPWVDNQGVDLLTNSNRLFWSYDGVDGGKTGFNKKDKQSSITTATRNNRRLISIVLDSPENDVFTDSEILLDYGFNGFKKGILVSKNQPLQSVVVSNREINLQSMNDVYYTYPMGENYVRKVEFDISKDLKLPLTKTQVAGIAHYTLKDGTVININLYPDTDILLPEGFYTKVVNKLKEHRDLYILIIILLILEVFIIIYKLVTKAYKRIRQVQ